MPCLSHTARQIAQAYLRLSNLGNDAFERVNHYEARLWRQLAQTLVTLGLKKRSLPLKRSGLLGRIHDRDESNGARPMRIY